MNIKRDKTIVGRVEKVDFPELGILDIEAKIDTGAYSTAIHSHRIWVEEKDGVEYLN
ncbi:MAG: ATP-dependent zinc protease [Flavobacteriales bacterium]|nr:ATP-dependent zinc protease [Flavobacteriales bacterium]